MTDDTITISAGPRFRAAMILAIIADALQIAVFPLFVGGALSPADDVLDFQQTAAVPEMHDRIIAGVARRLRAPLIASDPLIIAANIVTIVW